MSGFEDNDGIPIVQESGTKTRVTAEQLIGSTFSMYDRQSSLDLTVIKAVDISDFVANENPYKGPVFLCYGEDSRGVFVQLRGSYPDGSEGFAWHYGIDIVESDIEVRSRFESEVALEARASFPNFVVKNAPTPTGGPIGVPPSETSIHLDIPVPN